MRLPETNALLVPLLVSLTAPTPLHAARAAWIATVSRLLSSGVDLLAVSVWQTFVGSVGSGGRGGSPTPQARGAVTAAAVDDKPHTSVAAGGSLLELHPAAASTPATAATSGSDLQIGFTRRLRMGTM